MFVKFAASSNWSLFQRRSDQRTVGHFLATMQYPEISTHSDIQAIFKKIFLSLLNCEVDKCSSFRKYSHFLYFKPQGWKVFWSGPWCCESLRCQGVRICWGDCQVWSSLLTFFLWQSRSTVPHSADCWREHTGTSNVSVVFSSDGFSVSEIALLISFTWFPHSLLH